jgi:hypothetical protein
MEMLPSMRLPIPSTSTGSDFGSDVAPSDRGGDGDRTSLRISRGRTEQPYEKHNEGDDGRIAALKKGEEVWTEIAKNLIAAVKADNQQDKNSKDLHEVNDESESPEVEGSPRREGSGSPETDVDFRESSSDVTDIEWVWRSKIVGLKASDAVFMVEANGVESATGEISGDLSDQNEETLIGSEAVTKKELGEENFNTSIPVSVEYAKDTIKHQGESEEGEERTKDNQRRRNRRNIGLAASATAVAVAAIWMMERLDMVKIVHSYLDDY